MIPQDPRAVAHGMLLVPVRHLMALSLAWPASFPRDSPQKVKSLSESLSSLPLLLHLLPPMSLNFSRVECGWLTIQTVAWREGCGAGMLLMSRGWPPILAVSTGTFGFLSPSFFPCLCVLPLFLIFSFLFPPFLPAFLPPFFSGLQLSQRVESKRNLALCIFAFQVFYRYK